MTENNTELSYLLERRLCTIGYNLQQSVAQAELIGEPFDYNKFLTETTNAIDLAIDKGVNINNLFETSAIYCVLVGCMSAHMPLEVVDLRRDLIAHLISKGADVNLGYFGGPIGPITPMQIAKAERYDDIVELLEKNGTQKGSKTTKDKTTEQALERE